MKKAKIGLVSGLVVCVAILFVGAIVVKPSNHFMFDSNVYINNNSVRGLSKQGAYEKVFADVSNKLQDSTVEFVYNNKSWKISSEDMQVDEAVKKVVDVAYKDNISNSKVANAINKGNYQLSFKSVYKNLSEKIDQIESEINQEPTDSYVEFNPNNEKMFNVKKSKAGKVVNRDKLFKDIELKFLQEKNIKINIPVSEITPNVNEEFYSNKLEKMSEFKTSLKNSQEGRKHNVSFALSKFNGMVVKPNQIVHFNSVTGPQTLEAGYKNAIIILNGKFVQGVGGGLCQASTTLYNACLLANLQVNEVHRHSLPVKYVDLGLDAMVSEGNSDFVFTNTSENDVYIKAGVKNDYAFVEIYGRTKEDDEIVQLKTEREEGDVKGVDKIIMDTNREYTNKVIYKGEYYRLKYPKNNYQVKVYKNILKKGKVESSQLIRIERYPAEDGVVIQGVEELPQDFNLPENNVKIFN